MLAGLVKQQFTCCSVHDEDSTVQGCGLGEVRQKLNYSKCLMFCPLSVLDRCPLQSDALSSGRGVFSPLRRPLFTRLPPSLPDSLSRKIPVLPGVGGCTPRAHKHQLLNIMTFLFDGIFAITMLQM